MESGESFDTPEVLLTFTHQGFTHLSQNYHRFLKKNICRSKYTFARRPVLINNWEATYFDFDSDKILQIARQAKELGVEMLVLDDGWFGKRNDDNSGLGDWFVNKSKLPDGLEPLIAQINDMGLKFGLWVEPEMVNEDFGCDVPMNQIPMGDSSKTKQSYSGTVLMYGGYILPQMFGNYPSVQIYLKKDCKKG